MSTLKDNDKVKMQFDVDVAKAVGVEEAILHSNIAFWCNYHESQNSKRHFRDNNWWSYNSTAGFAKLFSFWSERQIIRMIRNLVSSGYLLEQEYNEMGYDKTKWYSAIYPNKQVDLPKQADGSTQMGRPIPDNKPDEKTTDKVYTAERSSVTVETEKYSGKLIAEFIDQFKHVNPMYGQFFGRPPQRKAIIALLDTEGEERLQEIMKILPAVQKMPYGPNITSPVELMHNLGKLYGFIEKEKSKIKSQGYKMTF